MMKRWIRPMHIRAAWVCLAVMVSGCERNEFKPPPPPPVTVAAPVQREVSEYAEYTGVSSAYKEATIYARVSGYLQDVHFKGSDDVKKGQLLFTINQDVYIAARDKAEGEWRSRQAELRLATDKLNAIRQAHSNDSATNLELWQGEANEQLATAQLASAKAALDLAELDLGFTEIKAPFDGRISETYVDPGNLIGDGERTKMATLVQFQPMYVYFDVPERSLLHFLADSSRVRDTPNEKKRKLYLVLADGRQLEESGEADYADPNVNATTGTLLIRAVFSNNDQQLYPGLFVQVRALLRTEPRLLVPNIALQRDISGYFLMVLGEKQVEGGGAIPIAVKRNVKVGVLQGELRVVVEGLKIEDQVIVVGLQRARDDGPVTPQRGRIDQDGRVIRPGVSEAAGSDGGGDAVTGPAEPTDKSTGE
jgi:membrane fusion protein, multidrug efflux system